MKRRVSDRMLAAVDRLRYARKGLDEAKTNLQTMYDTCPQCHLDRLCPDCKAARDALDEGDGGVMR